MLVETKEILRMLESYRCRYNMVEAGEGHQLIDLLSPYETVREGKEELESIADFLAFQISQALDAKFSVKCRECDHYTEGLCANPAWLNAFDDEKTPIHVDAPIDGASSCMDASKERKNWNRSPTFWLSRSARRVTLNL